MHIYTLLVLAELREVLQQMVTIYDNRVFQANVEKGMSGY